MPLPISNDMCTKYIDGSMHHRYLTSPLEFQALQVV
jgi:hypothetical protein